MLGRAYSCVDLITESKCWQTESRVSTSQKIPFSEEETKGEMISVHIILGAADYQRIRTTEPSVLGSNPDKDPGAEFTKLGWAMYRQRAGSECPVDKQFFLRSSTDEFAKQCNLDIFRVTNAKSEIPRFMKNFWKN